jgi:OOP family OmpA-OmpF porin
MAAIDTFINETARRLGLGDSAAPLVREVLGLITGNAGGVAGVIARLRDAGFGALLADWFAGRAEQPLGAQGVQQLFGAAKLAEVSQRLGLSRERTTGAVGEVLPGLLALLAPGGTVSQGALNDVAHRLASVVPAPMAGLAKAGPAPPWTPFRTTLPVAALIGLAALLWSQIGPRIPPAPPQAPLPLPDIAPPAPVASSTFAPWLRLETDDRGVTATGVVRDAAARDGILDALRGVFGADRTRAGLVVDPSAGDAPWLGNLGGLFDKLRRGGLSVLFEGKTVSLGGLPDAAARTDLVNRLKGLLPADFSFGDIGERVDALVAGSARQATAALGGLTGGYTARDVAAALNYGIINFATGSAELPAGAGAMLDAAASKLKTLSGAVIEVAGYTDSTGDAAANLKLSQDRADAVRARLLSAGVPAAMIQAKGYGSADPVASNDTPEGRFRNRRIEYRVGG